MIKKMKRGAVIYALDIGSRQLKGAAALISSGHKIEEIIVEAAPAKGIFKGVVNDLVLLSEALRSLLSKLEKKTSVRCGQVFVGINGNYINARSSAAAVALSERGPRAITRKDIDYVMRQARSLGLSMDESLLHEFPQRFFIDRQYAALNPLGLHGRRFEVDLLLISANAGYLENVGKAVERAGFDMAGLVFSAVAAASLVLSPEEKQKGVVFVDIGDALTEILVFKRGALRRANVFSFGGKNLTEVISNYFKIPYDLAERIKEAHVEVGRPVDEEKEVMVRTENDCRAIKRKELVDLVEPEIDRFVSQLKSFIFDGDQEDGPPSSVIATGGMSLLEGLLEKIEHGLGLPVKMGVVRGLKEMSTLRTPSYACAIGLLDFYHNTMSKRRGPLFSSDGSHRFAGVIDYLKHFYTDYF